MARFGWQVTYDNNTVLSDVQNVSFSRGRQEIQDTFRAGRATISGRDLASLPTLEIGKQIVVEISYGSPLTYQVCFIGQIADVQITYGMVPNADTWRIECEDTLAKLGRAYTTDSFSWAAGINTLEAASLTALNATNSTVNITGFSSFVGSSLVSAQSLPNANVLDVVNTLIATEQSFIYSSFATTPSPGVYDQTINFVPRSALGQSLRVAIFSDGTHPVGVFPDSTYDQVLFRSYADSFYERVVVEPVGLAPQSKGTGIRTYTLRSFDQTTTQAANLADYVKATFDVQIQKPSVLSFNSESQANDVLANIISLALQFTEIDLYLRGVKYTLFVLGLTTTADPDQTRVTLNVASSEALNFFILDSPTFGVLDTNKLGF